MDDNLITKLSIRNFGPITETDIVFDKYTILN